MVARRQQNVDRMTECGLSQQYALVGVSRLPFLWYLKGRPGEGFLQHLLLLMCQGGARVQQAAKLLRVAPHLFW